MATLIYLGGDAYPDEADCEKRLAWVLATSNSFGFISQCWRRLKTTIATIRDRPLLII